MTDSSPDTTLWHHPVRVTRFQVGVNKHALLLREMDGKQWGHITLTPSEAKELIEELKDFFEFEDSDEMSELHTDDTFMYENCLVGDGVMGEDPLVNRITHQRGGRVSYTFKEVVENKGVVDWNSAPDWASYWAMDSNGEAYWYFEHPTLSLTDTDWGSCDLTDDAPDFGFPSELWAESLEKRPLDDQEQALDDLVRDAEDLGLYDETPADESEDPSELVDWSKAPDWATYWAINSKGIGFWFGDYFSTYQGEWSRNRVLGDGSATPAPSFGWPAEKWESSLVARPKEFSQNLSTEVNQEELDSLANRGSKLVKAMRLDKDPMHRQVSGSHYNKYPIQPAEYCYKNGLNNLQSEAISYITRYGDKGGKIDLEKAIHTLEMLIHMEYGE